MNVLFVAIDDLNDWTGFLGGHPDAHTPYLDAFAESSVVFRRAYCQAPLCNPSRASLMTGLRPSTTGVYSNHQPFRMTERGRRALTIPQVFRRHGYAALGSGKIYHNKYPDPVSWSEWHPDLMEQTLAFEPPVPRKPLNEMPAIGLEDKVDFGPLDEPDNVFLDYQTVDKCLELLGRQRRDQPFFLACGLAHTHLKWYSPRPFHERFDPEKISLPPLKDDDWDDLPREAMENVRPRVFSILRREGRWAEAVSAYLACGTFLDAQIGRLLKGLEESRFRDNTVVVLWSDHGWHLGEKFHWKKSTLWERATHVPLMIRAPGVSQDGTVCRRPVEHLDIFPTLLDLSGLPSKVDLEGTSLRPWLADPEAERDRPACTTWKWGNHSLRSERWRYTRYRNGTEELYDHETDPNEWVNLAADSRYEDVKREHARWLPEEDAPEGETLRWNEKPKEIYERLTGLLDQAPT